MSYVLGIETSCDDTSCSILKTPNQVLSNVVSTQVDFHRRFGGVVPEVASRKHLEFLPLVVDEALREAGVDLSALNLIAVTAGPGLMGSLLMGVSWAKTVALLHSLPLVGVNHLESHLFASSLENEDLRPPFLGLIISGGHTELVAVEEWGKYQSLGRTRDDAVGEAFDKVAKFLGLGYPGGPIIEELSRQGDKNRFYFAGGLERDKKLDFSFSGLKTAVIRSFKKLEPKNEQTIADLVASFQESVVRTLVKKTVWALELTGFSTVAVGGGVAANQILREAMDAEARARGFKVFFPSLPLCTDNAAMVALCGFFYFARGWESSLEFEPNPRLSLGELPT